MKHIILILCLIAPAYGLSLDKRLELVNALAMVESHNNPHVQRGDHGKAYGILQIRKEMIEDANRISRHETYILEDAENPLKAREIALKVLTYYNDYILRVEHREATAQELAYIWNGGGSTWKRVFHPRHDEKQSHLEIYWNKVSKYYR